MKNTKKEPKFKIGDLVRHISSDEFNAVRLVVTSVGILENENAKNIIYQLSGEKQTYVPKDDIFFRVILEETELIAIIK